MSRSEIEKQLAGKGDFIQIDYLNRFIAQKPPLHEKKFAFMKLIEIYSSKKMFNDVAKIYNNLALLALSPQERIECLTKEIKAHIQSGRFDEAVRSFDRTLDINNNCNRAICEKAIAVSSLGNQPEALALFDQALEHDPTNPKILFSKGIALSRMEKYIEAIETFELALSREPDNASGYY